MNNWLNFFGTSGSVESLQLPNQHDPVQALQVFREPVDFSISACVPKVRPFGEIVDALISTHNQWINGEKEKEIVWKVRLQVFGDDPESVDEGKSKENSEGVENQLGKAEEKGSVLSQNYDDSEAFFDGEQVHEEEREQEIEQEQEKEQEIEIEKYVDLAYRRDNEAPIPWPFAMVIQDREYSLKSNTFYQAGNFRLWNRRALHFPDDLMVSTNYFNLRWSGERQIKNVVVVLEWVPSASHLDPQISSAFLENCDPLSLLPSDSHRNEFFKAFRLLDREGRKALRGKSLISAVQCALDLYNPSQDQLKEILDEFGEKMDLPNDKNDTPDEEENEWDQYEPVGVTPTNFCKLILAPKHKEIEKGRSFVVVSLAEAETIRRILHSRQSAPSLCEGSHVNSSCSLRINFSSTFHTIDSFQTHPPAYEYQIARSHNLLQFLNSELYYKERGVSLLLRSLEIDPPHLQQLFFCQITGCRRRSSKRWEESPLSLVMVLLHAIQLICIRSQGSSIRNAMEVRGMYPFDLFRQCDIGICGSITPEQLWGGFEWMGVNVTAEEILDIYESFDSNRDGVLNYREFLELVREPGATLEQLEQEDEGNEEEGVTTEDGVALLLSGDDFHQSSSGSINLSESGDLSSSGNRSLTLSINELDVHRGVRQLRSQFVCEKGKAELKKAREKRDLEKEALREDKEE